MNKFLNPISYINKAESVLNDIQKRDVINKRIKYWENHATSSLGG